MSFVVDCRPLGVSRLRPCAYWYRIGATDTSATGSPYSSTIRPVMIPPRGSEKSIFSIV